MEVPHMAQDRSTEQDRSTRSEETERSDQSESSERTDSMRGRSSEDSGGITNRSLEEEICEQDELPARGRSRSDQSSDRDESER
jgi:hypothetical protein